MPVDGKFTVGSLNNSRGGMVNMPRFVADFPNVGEPAVSCLSRLRGGHMRGRNVRRRWWSQAVAAGLLPRKVGDRIAYEFKVHKLRHTAASLAFQAGAKIKSLRNMLGHESAGLTLDLTDGRPGYTSGCHQRSLNSRLWAKCGHGGGSGLIGRGQCHPVTWSFSCGA